MKAPSAMNDPHVELLVYELKHGETVKYENPPAAEIEKEGFRLRLSEGTLHVEMLSHCPNVAGARNLVEPFLKDWETHVLLESGHERLCFEFEDSEVIERDPPGPGEPQTVRVSDTLKIKSRAWITVLEEEYPAPPTYDTLSPDAATMAFRYKGYRNDREPLLSMAYFCLTVMEQRARNEVPDKVAKGKRNKAAEYYNVESDILGDVGELTGEQRGDSRSARKFNLEQKALTGKERNWVDRAIRRLTIQVALVDAGEEPEKLKVEDLRRK